jgi:2-polyprenyl-6-hydroxyphenyl methylase/3-demethylubiquinone-9 3-methyltransferase
MKTMTLSLVDRVRKATLALDRAPIADRHAYRCYHDEVARLLASGGFSRVLDVGGGRGAAYDGQFPRPGVHLTVVDVDAEELQLNEAADEVLVGDISNPELDFGGRTFDLILIRAGIEHFPDNQAAVANLARVLEPGGFLLATFASRWAPFAILNRLVPQGVKKRILVSLVPGSDGFLGFEAHYDRCTRSAFGTLLIENGLAVHRYYPSYDGSSYFAAIPPIYVISRIVDIARWRISNPALASFHYFAAHREDAAKCDRPANSKVEVGSRG